MIIQRAEELLVPRNFSNNFALGERDYFSLGRNFEHNLAASVTVAVC
jgi:hypothetical protein